LRPQSFCVGSKNKTLCRRQEAHRRHLRALETRVRPSLQNGYLSRGPAYIRSGYDFLRRCMHGVEFVLGFAGQLFEFCVGFVHPRNASPPRKRSVGKTLENVVHQFHRVLGFRRLDDPCVRRPRFRHGHCSLRRNSRFWKPAKRRESGPPPSPFSPGASYPFAPRVPIAISAVPFDSRGEIKAKMIPCAMPLSCRVTFADILGSPHTTEVLASSLFDAVAQALLAIPSSRSALPNGFEPVAVVVLETRQQFHVKLTDFLKWLDRRGNSPRAVTHRRKIRSILQLPRPG
jgi:hypothetical protein